MQKKNHTIQIDYFEVSDSVMPDLLKYTTLTREDLEGHRTAAEWSKIGVSSESLKEFEPRLTIKETRFQSGGHWCLLEVSANYNLKDRVNKLHRLLHRGLLYTPSNNLTITQDEEKNLWKTISNTGIDPQKITPLLDDVLLLLEIEVLKNENKVKVSA